jgi:hypothetical protein
VRIRLALATAVLFALAAAPASAKIVVNRSIAGVRLNMTQQQVLDLHPDPSGDITNQALDTIYTYKNLGVKVTFRPHGSTNNVTSIEVYRRGQRTAAGVGVGSSYRAVRAGVPGVRCIHAPGNPRQRWCTVKSGRKQTTFVISSARRVHGIFFSYLGD